MIEAPLFTGKLVRLAAPDPETDPPTLARWSRDAEYLQLYAADPALPRPPSALKKGLEEELDQPDSFVWMIYPLDPAARDPIGVLTLDGIEWNNRSAWLSVGLGERHAWGQGYGADATRLALRYAFDELNLYRLSLTVFEYNPRAIRLYQKLGFSLEGRVREFLHRDGRRWDMLAMGLLRPEWEAGQP